jgi:hypothetical protein
MWTMMARAIGGSGLGEEVRWWGGARPMMLALAVGGPGLGDVPVRREGADGRAGHAPRSPKGGAQ